MKMGLNIAKLQSLCIQIKAMMIKFDRFLFNSMFGMVIPILFFLAFWWGSLLFSGEERFIMISALTGLSIGIIISLFLKLTWKPEIYCLPKPVLELIYLFYNACMFGFFMGVPVFHPILGVIAGYYWAKRLCYQAGMADYKTEIKKVSGFTATVTGFVCLFSAFFALISKSTPSDLKHMLHLSFDLTQTVLISLIISGGLFLVFAQYLLTKITMTKMLKMNKINLI
jgi:hypothetical protein